MSPDLQTNASLQYARWRNRVAYLSDIATASSDLTERGQQLLSHVTQSSDAVRLDDTVKIDTVIRELARTTDHDSHLSWRLRNLRVNDKIAEQLANAWTASMPCPAGIDLSLVTVAGTGVIRRFAREQLGLLRIADRSSFDELSVNPRLLSEQFPGATDADLLLVGHDLERARELYVGEVLANPHDPEPWVGLGLVSTATSDMAGFGIQRNPEIVHAVHQLLWQQHRYAVDPFQLAMWLFSALLSMDGSEFRVPN